MAFNEFNFVILKGLTVIQLRESNTHDTKYKKLVPCHSYFVTARKMLYFGSEVKYTIKKKGSGLYDTHILQ